MDIVKMPLMKKSEYDTLINEECICRIAFAGDSHPYIAPFLYDSKRNVCATNKE
jgi:nitroimidazol reductase NimA-like FMN-containing flavoprotein (pyridoxamine 5'-phosphate oxidase superfamily)